MAAQQCASKRQCALGETATLWWPRTAACGCALPRALRAWLAREQLAEALGEAVGAGGAPIEPLADWHRVAEQALVLLESHGELSVARRGERRGNLLR